VPLIASMLNTTTSLTHLDLSHNFLGKKAAFTLANCIRTNTTLKALFINECSFDKEGVESIADALHINTTLQYVDMNNPSSRSMSMEKLVSLLNTNTTLITLVSGSVRMSDENNVKITRAVQFNPTIQECRPTDYTAFPWTREYLYRNAMNVISREKTLTEIAFKMFVNYWEHEDFYDPPEKAIRLD